MWRKGKGQGKFIVRTGFHIGSYSCKGLYFVERHLLGQDPLVIVDAPLEALYALVLADPDFLGDLVDERRECCLHLLLLVLMTLVLFLLLSQLLLLFASRRHGCADRRVRGIMPSRSATM